MPLVEKIPERHSGFIDVRGPRVAAGITAAFLLGVVFLGLIGAAVDAGASPWERVIDPAYLLLLLVWVNFALGAFAPPAARPLGLLYTKAIQPRIRPAQLFEDPRPPRFAQLVGFLVTSVGILLGAWLPWAVVISAAFAFVAAFLNAAFGYCLGCELYLWGRGARPRAQQ